MPSPSDLEWWQWLLCAAGFWLIAWIIVILNREHPGRRWLIRLISFLGGAGGLICAAIGIIRLVKWVWNQ